MSIANFFLKRRLQSWRDDEFYAAALVLRQLAADLVDEASRQVAALPKLELLTQSGSFLSAKLAPLVREASEPVMLRLTEQANKHLSELLCFSAIWASAPTDDPSSNRLDGWQEVALASAPLAGGVAAAASLPTIAVTTTASMFGLVTTTAISWPVVIGGGVVAGSLVATGIWNSAQLIDRLRLRLQRKATEQIIATLLTGRKSKALLEQYADILDQTVAQARRAS